MCPCFFGFSGQRLERARAKREKCAGGTFWCPCACGGTAVPPASLVARSKKIRTHECVSLFFCMTDSHAGDIGHRLRMTGQRLPCVGGAVGRSPTEGACAHGINPSGAARHLPLHRGGFWRGTQAPPYRGIARPGDGRTGSSAPTKRGKKRGGNRAGRPGGRPLRTVYRQKSVGGGVPDAPFS